MPYISADKFCYLYTPAGRKRRTPSSSTLKNCSVGRLITTPILIKTRS